MPVHVRRGVGQTETTERNPIRTVLESVPLCECDLQGICLMPNALVCCADRDERKDDNCEPSRKQRLSGGRSVRVFVSMIAKKQECTVVATPASAGAVPVPPCGGSLDLVFDDQGHAGGRCDNPKCEQEVPDTEKKCRQSMPTQRMVVDFYRTDVEDEELDKEQNHKT